MVTWDESRKRAAILTRRSVEDKQETASIEFQKSMCQKKADELGYKVVIVEVEEKSAYNLPIEKRNGLQTILNMVMDNELEAVICWQKSRLVRDVGDEAIISSIFEKSECEVVFADPNEISMGKGSGDVQRLLNIIKTWSDEAEVAKLRSRIKQHLRERASQGKYVGGTYSGYQWNKQTKYLEQVPGEIEVVKKIYKLYMYEGLSSKQIAAFLNNEGFKTKKGKKFKAYSIVRILQCKIYCGYYRWGYTTSKRRASPELAEGYDTKVEWVDGIITLEEWNDVQNIMISRSGKKRGQQNRSIPKSSFLLSNLLYCGYCNSKMYGRNGTKKYRRKDGSEGCTEHFKYYCNSPNSHTVPKRIDSKMLDKVVLEQIAHQIKRLDMNALFDDVQTELADIKNSLQTEKKGIERRIEKNKKAVENLLINLEKSIDTEMLRLLSDRIKSKKECTEQYLDKVREIEKKIKYLGVNKKDLQEFINYLSTVNNHHNFTQEKKKMYIERLVDKVIVSGDEVEVYLKWDILGKSPVDEESNVNIDLQFNLAN